MYWILHRNRGGDRRKTFSRLCNVSKMQGSHDARFASQFFTFVLSEKVHGLSITTCCVEGSHFVVFQTSLKPKTQP